MSHPLLARLASADPEERIAACRAAAADPSAVLFGEALVERLGDPVPAVAAAASQSLAGLAQTHDVKPTLHAALREGAPQARLWAALTLTHLDPPSVRLLPALVDGLALGDGKLRWQAARVLVTCGRLHGEVLPLLLGLSRGDERALVRRMARHCLRELARDDRHAAAALFEGTRDEDVPARRAAYAALPSLLDPAPEILHGLIQALSQEPDPASRRIATVALAELAPQAPEALRGDVVAALTRTRDGTEDPDLRRGAERALSRIAADPRRPESVARDRR